MYTKVQNNQRGQQGVVMVLVLVVAFMVLLPIGLLVFETSRSQLAQQQLKAACDAAALGAAMDYTGGDADQSARATQAALDYLRRNTIIGVSLERTEVGPASRRPDPNQCILHPVTIDQQTNELTAHAEFGLTPVFGSLLGLQEYKLAAISKAMIGTGRLDIVLVLDCSYSMLGDNAIRDAKAAAQAFVRRMQAGGENHFALISYSNAVAGATTAEAGTNGWPRAMDTGERGDVQRESIENGSTQLLNYVELQQNADNAQEVIRAIGPLRAQGNSRFEGQTNTAGALRAAIRFLNDGGHRPGAEKVIVLITDGLPNVGRNPVQETYEAAERAGREGITIYSLGFFHPSVAIWRGQADTILNEVTRRAGGESKLFFSEDGAQLSRDLSEITSSDVALSE